MTRLVDMSYCIYSSYCSIVVCSSISYENKIIMFPWNMNKRWKSLRQLPLIRFKLNSESNIWPRCVHMLPIWTLFLYKFALSLVLTWILLFVERKPFVKILITPCKSCWEFIVINIRFFLYFYLSLFNFLVQAVVVIVRPIFCRKCEDDKYVLIIIIITIMCWPLNAIFWLI